MEIQDNKRIYNLTIPEGTKAGLVLKETSDRMYSELKNEFGADYEVTVGKINEDDDSWSHEYKIRKGMKIGGSVGLKWKKELPSNLEIEADESTKIGTILAFGILVPFLLIGAYMGANDIQPLAFLPGYKIAAGLGALIMLIPGAIIMFIAKSIILRKEKTENKELVDKLLKLVSRF